jgi:heterodisulfide reductase subunit C
VEDRDVNDHERPAPKKVFCLVIPAMEKNEGRDSQEEEVSDSAVSSAADKGENLNPQPEPPCIGCGLCAVLGCPLGRSGPPEY